MLEYFYHQTIRQVIIALGTLFNNIYVSRRNSSNNELERIKIPIAYAPKQKFIVRQESSDPELVHNVNINLPKLGYEITGIQYDPTRKLTTMQQSVFYDETSDNSVVTRLERVPYNLTFALHIVAKNTDDAFQILEQILPYFTPDFTLTIKDIGIDNKIDIPIVIANTSFSELYEGDFSKRKQFLITIDFNSKIHLYGPSTRSKIITQSIVNFYDRYDSEFMVLPGATGITGNILETMIFTVTGGATAGSIGETGSIDTQIIEW